MILDHHNPACPHCGLNSLVYIRPDPELADVPPLWCCGECACSWTVYGGVFSVGDECRAAAW